MQIDFPIPTAAEVSPAGRAIDSKVSANNGQKAPLKEETNQQSEERPVASAIERLQSSLEHHDISLKFSRDDETRTMVVQLVNSRSGEAIRQIPTEVSLKLTAELGRLQGWILNQQV